MSKKAEAHSHSHSTPPRSEFSQSEADWLAQAQAAGVAVVAAEKRVQIDGDELVRSAANIKTLVRRNPQLEAAAQAVGLDANYWAALAAQAATVDKLTKQVPTDLRTIELVTPAERSAIDGHAEFLGDIRDGVARYARSQGALEQVDLLGRGEPVGASPAALFDSYNNFLTHAPERAELLHGAAVGSAVLAQLGQRRDQLQQIKIDSGARRADKEALPEQVLSAKRGLLSLLEVYAGRMGTALAGQTQLRRTALKQLPRRAERRHGSSDGGEGAGSGSGETGGGTGTAAADASAGAKDSDAKS